MSRKIFSTLAKAKDKLKQTIKQKMPRQEDNQASKTLQSIWDEHGKNLKKATSNMQGLSSKINLKSAADFLNGAGEASLREKISKLTKSESQKSKGIEQPTKSSIQALRKSGSDFMDKIKSLNKENLTLQNLQKGLKQSGKKEQKAISQMEEDKSKESKQQNHQFVMSFLKAKARDIDSRLKVISTEMKKSSLIPKSSFLQLFKGFIINFYWRFIMIVSFVAFAYGFGSSLPKEIRKALKEKDEKPPEAV